MVDLTVRQRGMKLGDGRFDCCIERNEIVGFTVALKGMKLEDGRFDCCTMRYETWGW